MRSCHPGSGSRATRWPKVQSLAEATEHVKRVLEIVADDDECEIRVAFEPPAVV